MSEPQVSRLEQLNSQLNESLTSTGHIQTILTRMIKVLESRQVQVMIDFDDMFDGLRTYLESAQKNSVSANNQLSQLQELVNTSALLTSSLDLDQVLTEVIDTVIKLTRAERAYLMLRHGESEDLRIQLARNQKREMINPDEVTFSQGILHTAIESGVPLITTNAQEDERFQDMKSVISHDLRSIIIVPLILKNNVVGVLYVDNRIEQGVFSQENVPLLTAFANQAAIAISNARLFEKVKGDLKEAQRQVQRLQIEIDQARLQEKVTEITDSDYFQYLTAKAKDLRDRTKGNE